VIRALLLAASGDLEALRGLVGGAEGAGATSRQQLAQALRLGDPKALAHVGSDSACLEALAR